MTRRFQPVRKSWTKCRPNRRLRLSAADASFNRHWPARPGLDPRPRIGYSGLRARTSSLSSVIAVDTPSKIDRGTLGGTRISRSVTLSFGLLRKHLWLWPLLAALMLAVAGLWIRQSVERAAKDELAKSLQTVLNADVAALAIWMENHVSHVRSLADGGALRRLAGQLAQVGQTITPDDSDQLVQSDLH